MVLLRSSAFVLVLGAQLVHAAAVKRQSITSLNSSQIASFNPFTLFASTAYCNASTTMTWSCGANCNANSDFVPVASGGDGNDVQFWYVGFSPSQDTVIVAHQGTDPYKLLADLTDVDLSLGQLNTTLFPGISSSVEVHSGFASEHASTAPTILSAVLQTLSAHETSTVTVVGHSLGAALALLDAVFFRVQLSANVTVQMHGYGLPRVGNQDFADWVDANLTGLVTHVNNKKDPVPIVPGMSWGYVHPSGEVHITESGSWDTCPGQDNPSTLCTVGDVSNVIDGDLSDHHGPYNGIEMDC